MSNSPSGENESGTEDLCSPSVSVRAECDSLSPPRGGFDSWDEWEDPDTTKALKYDLERRSKRMKNVKRVRKATRHYLEAIDATLRNEIPEKKSNDLLWSMLTCSFTNRSRSPLDHNDECRGLKIRSGPCPSEKSPADVYLPPRPPSPLSSKSLYIEPEIFLKLASNFKDEQMGLHGVQSWMWGDFLRPQPASLSEHFTIPPTKTEQLRTMWMAAFGEHNTSVVNHELNNGKTVFESRDGNATNLTLSNDNNELMSHSLWIGQKLLGESPKDMNNICEETTADDNSEHSEAIESSSITSSEMTTEESEVKPRLHNSVTELSPNHQQDNINVKSEVSKKVPEFDEIESSTKSERDVPFKYNRHTENHSISIEELHPAIQNHIVKTRKTVFADRKIRGLHVPTASMLRALERAKMKERQEAHRQYETESNIFKCSLKQRPPLRNLIPMNSLLRAESRAKFNHEKVVKEQQENHTLHSSKPKERNTNINSMPMHSLLRAQTRLRAMELKLSQENLIAHTLGKHRIDGSKILAANSSVANVLLKTKTGCGDTKERETIANVIDRKRGCVILPPIGSRQGNIKENAGNSQGRTNKRASSDSASLQNKSHGGATATKMTTIESRLPPIKGTRNLLETTGIPDRITHNAKKPLPPVTTRNKKHPPFR